VTALFSDLQRAIEAVYRIDSEEEVVDFCIGSEHALRLLGPDLVGTRRELLLVDQRPEDPGLGLYVAEDVRQRAERFIGDPSSAHMDEFCVALEGVSHFVYFLYTNAQDRPVSLFELELQAEVDKFLLLRISHPLPGLVDRLFARFELWPGLEAQERARYSNANRNARRYARWLEHKFSRGEGQSAMEDARALYRKPLTHKLSHIARAA
jgi:hypothetical protein